MTGAGTGADDLAGKTIVVTGATSGIGLETARALARRGARVIACARSRERGRAALDDGARAGLAGTVELVVFDLASLADVRRGAAEILARTERLDVLVNNAAAMRSRRSTTEDGHETTFAVNHLGPFLLTNLLLDRLRDAPRARVVNVAARAHRRCPALRLDDPTFARGYSATAAYNHSKLANVAFTIELARRLEGSRVVTSAVHPGLVRSELGANGELRGLTGLAWRLIQPLLMSPVDGARSTVHAATAPELATVSGVYLEGGEICPPSSAARNTEAARRLWTFSEALVGL